MKMSRNATNLLKFYRKLGIQGCAYLFKICYWLKILALFDFEKTKTAHSRSWNMQHLEKNKYFCRKKSKLESQNCSHLKVIIDIEKKIADLNSEGKFRFKKHHQTYGHFYEAHFMFSYGWKANTWIHFKTFWTSVYISKRFEHLFTFQNVLSHIMCHYVM